MSGERRNKNIQDSYRSIVLLVNSRLFKSFEDENFYLNFYIKNIEHQRSNFKINNVSFVIYYLQIITRKILCNAYRNFEIFKRFATFNFVIIKYKYVIFILYIKVE